jgi:hypothetical protein
MPRKKNHHRTKTNLHHYFTDPPKAYHMWSHDKASSTWNSIREQPQNPKRRIEWCLMELNQHIIASQYYEEKQTVHRILASHNLVQPGRTHDN